MNEPDFSAFLNNDEKILWKGKPEFNIYFNKLDIFYIPISILFAIFTIKDFVLDQFDLFGTPFIVIGLYFLIGRFFVKNIKKKRTFYYVTNERVIVFNKVKAKILQEKDINTIKTIKKSLSRFNVGSLEFGNPTIIQVLGGNTGLDIMEKSSFYESSPRVPIFYDIQNCEQVYELINQLSKSKHGAW